MIAILVIIMFALFLVLVFPFEDYKKKEEPKSPKYTAQMKKLWQIAPNEAHHNKDDSREGSRLRQHPSQLGMRELEVFPVCFERNETRWTDRRLPWLPCQLPL